MGVSKGKHVYTASINNTHDSEFLMLTVVSKCPIVGLLSRILDHIVEKFRSQSPRHRGDMTSKDEIAFEK